jgi:hypothetical protein
MARTSRINTKISDKVIDAVENSGNGTSHGIITLSTGVQLQCRKISPLLMTDVMRQFQKPRVPMFYNEDLGREEENPNDPIYIENLDNYNRDMSLAILDTMIVAGTSIKYVPEDVENVDGTEWRETMEAAGIKITENKKRTYLFWVKHVAATSDTDTGIIMEGVGRMSGVAASDVDSAVKQFRNRS